MTIIEAVKTGKPFRRKEWVTVDSVVMGNDYDHWLVWNKYGLPVHSMVTSVLGKITREDFLADDWEVKREKVKKTGWVYPHEIYPSSHPGAIQVTFEVEEE